ncbi:MAG: tripartite tricarboxylate transporter substrate binding protein [Gemmatimonadaceae bacterium]|nr:tripartite tricarboxylate transporter substrate binding protein [Acetobacteraceae bacterium]
MKHAVAACLVFSSAGAAMAQAWEPTKTIEIVVPFAPGGASDQMARTMQAIVQKNNLSKQPMVVVNKPAAAGAEAMMDIRNSSGDPHKLITTSSAIYMIPLSSKLPVNWRNFTPIAMVAQDEFLLWTYTEAPFKTGGDFLAAAKTSSPALRIGGNGSKREDHLITQSLEIEAGSKITYIPYTGGGPTSVQLAGKHIEASTGNPSEEIGSWRAGNARPLCVLSAKRMAYTAVITAGTAWSDVPTCAESGVALQYNMLRGMFMPGKVTPAQQAYYVDLFRKVTQTAEWQTYVERNALLPDFRDGDAFVAFLTEDEQRHKDMMAKAGFLAQ